MIYFVHDENDIAVMQEMHYIVTPTVGALRESRDNKNEEQALGELGHLLKRCLRVFICQSLTSSLES